jgi:site-specific DNA-methyltransferase (adenine-specific)
MLDLNRLYLMDCMDGMAQFPDKFFQLAICDPPYGIGEDGSKNHTRSCIAKSTDYKAFHGNDLRAPDQSYFDELMRVSKTRLSLARTILSRACRLILRAGLFGIKTTARTTLQIVS